MRKLKEDIKSLNITYRLIAILNKKTQWKCYQWQNMDITIQSTP